MAEPYDHNAIDLFEEKLIKEIMSYIVFELEALELAQMKDASVERISVDEDLKVAGIEKGTLLELYIRTQTNPWQRYPWENSNANSLLTLIPTSTTRKMFISTPTTTKIIGIDGSNYMEVC